MKRKKRRKRRKREKSSNSNIARFTSSRRKGEGRREYYSTVCEIPVVWILLSPPILA